MNDDRQFHPHVYPTGDGERSTAGSNYGDWRPAQPPRPHGYDFESRFAQPPADGMAPDPDYRRLREEHELLQKAIRFCSARRATSSPSSRPTGDSTP